LAATLTTDSLGSVAMVMTDDFFLKMNYDGREIHQNRDNICGDKTCQKPKGHILTQKNWISISHTMEWSQLW
jgi:hypothetical protein